MIHWAIHGRCHTQHAAQQFGVIPNGHTPGKWHLITDLSSLKGQSVNDGIAPPLCSLRYVTVDDIAAAAAALGHGALITKLDVESAYRIMPVHPDDHPLLGIKWRDVVYIDAMLPFGLRSAPKNIHCNRGRPGVGHTPQGHSIRLALY